MIIKAGKNEIRRRKHVRVRKKISGTPERPRLNVFRSLKHIYAQIIDDTTGTTLVAASTVDKELKGKLTSGSNKEDAREVGTLKDSKAEERDAVSIMTVHAAKGLEFPVVLLPGCERHIFPHFRSVEEGTGEEERRLFYVALTRAKQRFVMSYAEKRRHRGKLSLVRPSPFLDELPQEYIVYCKPENALRPASREEVQQSLLDMIAEFSLE